MNPRSVDFLRRLIADSAVERRHGEVADTLATVEGIGKVKGAVVRYTEGDHAKARNLLTSRGFDISAPEESFSRSNAPRGSSEKTGALRVSDDLVAVVPIGILSLQIPSGMVLTLGSKAAQALPYEVLLVSENLEPMLQMHTYSWIDGYTKGRPTLVIFRGAPGYFRTDVAAGLIQRDSRPTLAFYDFDPKGLSMAASLPRREALCLPPWPQLRDATRENRRTNLFTQSVHTSRPHLERPEHHQDIALAWARLKELSTGLDQEHFPR
ncbi:MAG: hypothetical protein ACD_23C00751G0004 [uncultured bacterium]|jgi:hypothetical protein|nr:MAG: hypothetical protein ACD_23C00751G0004 [uncultured bacterium]